MKRGAPVVLDGSGKLAAVTVSGGPGTYKTEATGLYGILAVQNRTVIAKRIVGTRTPLQKKQF